MIKASPALRVGASVICAAALAGALSGCGGRPSKPMGTVTGKVTLDGQPVADLHFELIPLFGEFTSPPQASQDPKHDGTKPARQAVTDAQGNFAFGTEDPGVLTGWYEVAFDEEQARDKIPAHYRPAAGANRIFVEVQKGKNPPLNIELSSTPK